MKLKLCLLVLVSLVAFQLVCDPIIVAINAGDEIFCSKNSGKDWWNPHASSRLRTVSIAPDGTMWGTDGGQGVWYSKDGCKSYQKTSGGLKFIVAAPDGTLWGDNDGSSWYSKDGGKNWTKVSGTFKHMSVAPDGTVWGVDKSNHISYSADKGTTWTRLYNFSSIVVASDGILWGIGVSDCVFYSDNKGSSWKKTGDKKFVQIAIAPDGTLWGVNKEKELWSSKNKGKDWTKVRAGLVVIAVAPKAKDGEQPLLVGIDTSYKIFCSKNGGKDWEAPKKDGTMRTMSITPDGEWWGTGRDDGIWYSQDGGKSYKKANGGLKFVVGAPDGVLWGDNGDKTFYSTDKGKKWTSVKATFKSLSVASDGTVWGVNKFGSLLYSTDKGANWINNYQFKYVVAGADGTLWAINASTDTVFYSSDKGLSWKKTGDKKVKQLAIASDNTLWGVNSDKEVFYSKDKGLSWTTVSGKMVFIAAAPNDKFVPAKGWSVDDKEKEEAEKIKGELIKAKEALEGAFKKTGAGNTETINAVLERLYKQVVLAREVCVKSNAEFFAYLKSEFKQEAIENNLGKTLNQAVGKLKTRIEAIKKEASAIKVAGEDLKKEGAKLEERSNKLQSDGQKLGEKCNPFAQTAEVFNSVMGGLGAIKSGNPEAVAENALKAAGSFKDMGTASTGMAMQLVDSSFAKLGDLVGVKLSMPGVKQADITLGAAIQFTDGATGGLGKLVTGDFAGALSGFSSGLKGIGSGGIALVKSLKIDWAANQAKAAVEDAARAVSGALIDAGEAVGKAFNPSSWSSRRFKENIVDLALSDDLLDRLHAVSFNFKSDAAKTRQIGLIAEELYEIIPELVVLDENKLPVAVRYDLLSVVLLKELQKQSVMMREQEFEIKDLARRVRALEA